jgi:hypothetical protein
MHIPSVNFALRRHTFEEGKVYHEVSFSEAVEYWDDEDFYHPDNIDFSDLVMCVKSSYPITFMEIDTGKTHEYDSSYYYYEMDSV